MIPDRLKIEWAIIAGVRELVNALK